MTGRTTEAPTGGRSTSAGHAGTGGTRLLLAGMLLWAVVLAARWPLALSFGDEVGYVGQARLMLEGHMRPALDTPGVWTLMPEGPDGATAERAAKYPLIVSLLYAPLVAVEPRLVFAVNLLAALAIVWLAGRALRAWGRDPAWGLVVLLHPTVTLVARTAMADLLLSLALLAAWWALRRDRRVALLAAVAAGIAIKAVGVVLAGALLAGEAWRLRHALGAGTPGVRARFAWGAAGIALGLAATGALNLAATGHLWFNYDHRWLGTPPFWFKYFPTSAPVHAQSLLLVPPLLAAGAWSFWRRPGERDPGPLLLAAGLVGMMLFYYFVDHGRTWAETMVMGPRLVLPAVIFLLIGYADLLAGAAARLPRARPVVAAALLIAPAGLALAISAPHRRWQEPGAAALAVAARRAEALGTNEIGLTEGSLKVGLLYRGRARIASPRPDNRLAPRVVLCSSQSGSYRTADVALPCERPGYVEEPAGDLAAAGGFHVLVRK